MNTIVQNKFDLVTPCLILDLDILENNLRKMQKLADSKRKNLRPHAKTHKCIPIAKRQIELGAIGICAAKVSEAELLAKAGIHGILLTGPIASKERIKKIVDILSISPNIMVTVDNKFVVDNLNLELEQRKLSMDVLIDIDAGLKRTGINSANAFEFAEFILSKKNLHLRGIQAYAGHIQHIISYNERIIASRNCLEEIIPVFNKLKSMIERFTIFSASGTGTFEIDSSIPEITEHQVGSYCCMDAEYLAIESSTNSKSFKTFEPALRLLTTVISANQKGFVTVDAGLKSIYKDGAVPQILNSEYSSLKYDWFGDEYGKIIYQGNMKAPTLGAVLELVTSHCDPTINLFDRFYITQDEKVVDVWPIDLRGCSQ